MSAGERGAIVWRVSLSSPPERVFEILSTDRGRERFWVERSETDGDVVELTFPNGLVHVARVVATDRPRTFAIGYLGGSVASFSIESRNDGWTTLTLRDEGVPEEDQTETLAGWISVLMALKAAVDHGIDLRNHDPRRTWDQGFVDN